MGILDKAKRAVQGRSGQINKAVDSAARQINKRTDNKYADKVAKGSSKLKQTMNDLDHRSGSATADDTDASTDADTVTPRPPDPSPPHISRPSERG